MASSTSATSGGDECPRAPTSDASAAAGTAPLTLPQAHVEWAASMQAYYAAGGQPYAWHTAQQHLMAAAAAAAGAPYGTPVPFHPAYYATHASMATSVPYPSAEPVAVAEGKGKRKSPGAPSVGCTSGSAGGSENSSDKRDASAHHKVLPSVKRRKSSGANVQGEPSQAATGQDAAAESRITAKKRSAAKLSISTPEMAATSNVRPNLNIGMELWSDSPVKAETSGQGEIYAAAPSQLDSALSMMDERELKRERRKQSNRESARRSRLRKQQECEELAQKVTDLTAINGTLRSELDELKKACEDMEAENSQLMGELEQFEAPSVVTTLSIQIDTSKAHHRSSDQHGNRNNTDSKV
ncbi:DNA-binding protein EMBP-1 isoform X2 [Sorghum bicolor]|uniref:DNA-binding protein EMBP-1 isoform X2 n=1 Tax=Sorghum bicolor TaxID=4558 RepID=UPI0003C6EC91|nr:DNA-binding protein EMBP-1 isoform X2 [Sorghum bicolor]|eukprot:XP_021317833.1 DNA-binding protein EMBP-1 isoform X2 [Sorghum bicolor]